tara:strand:- start:238 stop:459 length:222 start_codon:yes stop_codon:yes gene_type:complete
MKNLETVKIQICDDMERYGEICAVMNKKGSPQIYMNGGRKEDLSRFMERVLAFATDFYKVEKHNVSIEVAVED